MIIFQSNEYIVIVSYIPRKGDTDLVILDAVEESEDPVNQEDIAEELHKGDELPNNDFCFTPKNFIETSNNVNDARH